MRDVYLYDAVRTPRGRARVTGALHEVRPFELVSGLLRALTERSPALDTAQVSDLLLGCVSPFGDQGYNIAQAGLQAAGWPETVAAATVNRYCASGLETVHQAAARVAAGFDEVIVAGGVESMSRVPLGSGGGALLRDPQLVLSEAAIPQGVAADLLASLRGYSREVLDAYALASQRRAAEASATGIVSAGLISILDASQISILDADEHPRPSTTLEDLAALPPAFAKTAALGFEQLALARYPQLECIDYVHTAGNSSGLVNGAAMVLVGSSAFGDTSGMAPRARIVSIAVASSEPTVMLLGLLPATERALARAGLAIKDIDLFEINEAFAAVPLAFCEHFGVDHECVNVNGGAIALGHPVGATGAILLGTLVEELHRRKLKRGLVALCAGGGQGIACVVETVTPEAKSRKR